jgi:hypothetical protein
MPRVTSNILGILGGILLMASSASAGDAGPPAGAASFERLKTLVGEWRGQTPKGRDVIVSYRVTANSTALVETWTLGPDRESITIYHMDRSALLASHFCPLGNQPRLALKRVSANRLDFEFRDGSDLDPAADAHQQSFWIEFQGPDAIVRSETYREGDDEETEAVRYVRSPAALSPR